MVTELTTSSGGLVLRTDGSQNCRVELKAMGATFELGVNTLAVVLERLLRGLQDNLMGPSAGTIDGVEVTGVLTLWERHATVYAAHRGAIRTLFFQDADGGLIARLELQDDERRRWIVTLEAEALRASTATTN
jgi:hypothetical protein